MHMRPVSIGGEVTALIACHIPLALSCMHLSTHPVHVTNAPFPLSVVCTTEAQLPPALRGLAPSADAAARRAMFQEAMAVAAHKLLTGPEAHVADLRTFNILITDKDPQVRGQGIRFACVCWVWAYPRSMGQAFESMAHLTLCISPSRARKPPLPLSLQLLRRLQPPAGCS